MKSATKSLATVRITPEQHEEIARIASLTEVTIGDVVTQLIAYGLRHSSIKPVHMYDLVFDETEEKG